MFTCFIRYQIEPGKLAEFREYAHAWIGLIRKYGGTHHGYFVPGTTEDRFPDTGFSFPGLGASGPPNIAIALFSFPGVEAYDQ
ncbi:MAG TPA: NIPSNAP family protein [Rhizomicrobium sp.]|nr:NIPSNAP family protein [Rhizomicrobium sp.]